MADSERPQEEKPADEARHAHARAILTVDERIAHIVGMMASFQWERGVSAPKLAAQWGLSVSTVEKHSQEAHRRITADKDEAERDITVGARKLFREAVQNGDAKAAKLMGDLWADVSGAKAPSRTEGTLHVAPVSLEDLDAMKAAALANECDQPPAVNEEPEPNS